MAAPQGQYPPQGRPGAAPQGAGMGAPNGAPGMAGMNGAPMKGGPGAPGAAPGADPSADPSAEGEEDADPTAAAGEDDAQTLTTPGAAAGGAGFRRNFKTDPHHEGLMDKMADIAEAGLSDDHIHSLIHIGTYFLSTLAHHTGMTAGGKKQKNAAAAGRAQ